jgi:hypothetical protein
MNKLELLTPCVLCTGARNKQGYGRRKYKGKDERAHRVAYAEHHGLTMADIKGVTIRHTCDNPPCINGEHLLAGTQLDNVRDMIERGRSGGRGPKGEACGAAVLTKAQVLEVRRRLKNGQIQSIIAKDFGVDRSTIGYIKAGKSWGHL